MRTSLFAIAVLAFIPSLVYGACYERYYTKEHLEAQKGKQQIRSVIIETEEIWGDFITDERIDIYHHFKKDGADHVAHASGQCTRPDGLEIFDLSEGDVFSGTCTFNAQKVTYEATISVSHMGINLSPVTFNVGDGFIYNDLSQGAKPGDKISVTNYDKTFKVFHNPIETNLNGRCEKALHLAYSHPVSRFWNEVILHSIRGDLARPTVTARNLFHLSALMWDVYAKYHSKENYFSYSVNDPETKTQSAFEKTLSFAAHEFLKQRYKLSPANTGDNYPEYEITGDDEEDYRTDLFLDRALKRMGHALEDSSQEAKLGRAMAQELIESQLNDGSREVHNYAAEESYVLTNQTILDISQTGIRPPLDLGVGINPMTYYQLFWEDYYLTEDLNLWDDSYKYNLEAMVPKSEAENVDINHWVRLNIPGAVDQGGTAQANEQSPLTLFWGHLPTFGQLDEKSPDKPGVYYDPGKHYPYFEDNPDQNPAAKLIDISPGVLGNNALGTNDGKGRSINPMTGKPYEPNWVKAADYYRSIAEYWADGPASETPPGHWNVIANYVLDDMKKLESDRENKWFGDKKLTNLEYQLRLYLTLNGALHDAAVVAWGIKGYYQGNRPVSVIRKLADMAQKDPEFAKKLESMSDSLKMVTYDKEVLLPGGKKEIRTVTKLAVKTGVVPDSLHFILGILMAVVLLSFETLVFVIVIKRLLTSRTILTTSSWRV